jgi:hypothetical protein
VQKIIEAYERAEKKPDKPVVKTERKRVEKK